MKVFFYMHREDGKGDEYFIGRLEFERNRAFLVTFEYGPKGTLEAIKTEKLELDARYLTRLSLELADKMGVEYAYSKAVELPDPKTN